MKRFVVNIAGLVVEISHYYDYVYRMCKEFIVDSYDHIDIFVESKLEEVDKIDIQIKDDYKEFMYVCKEISALLFNFNRILVHGAAISYNQYGFLFVAPSGTGKSTHIKHLRDNFEGIDIINGDKPILDSNGIIYGTPWAGKENWYKNVSFKLKAIIFVKRDKNNHINKIDTSDSLINVLNESYKDTGIDKAIDILSSALKDVSFYELYCTDSKESAELSFNAIINDSNTH